MVCFRNNHNKKEIVTEKRVKGKEETEEYKEWSQDEVDGRRGEGRGQKKGKGVGKPCKFCFFASNKEGTGTEPEPEIIMGPIHIFKHYLTYFL